MVAGGGGGGAAAGPGPDDHAALGFNSGDDEVMPAAASASETLDPDRDATPSSVESTADGDADPEPSQEPAQPPKRKGGRKPIYATSEERKQRNRQAQAAFRERRTEYIKQLEATIKQNEDSLSALQQSHRSAAEECLMLRYKNSLLERILLEKGIDVQTELSMKTGGSPNAFQHPTANIPHIPQNQSGLQRTTVQRQHARRSGQGFVQRTTSDQSNANRNFPASTQGHPTPSSHASSPTNGPTHSPMMVHQGMSTPSTSSTTAPPQGQQSQFSRNSQPPSNNPAMFQQQMSPHAQRTPSNAGGMRPQQPTSMGSHHSGGSHGSFGQPVSGVNAGTPASTSSGYYPSPFQKHIDQLEQEYDAQEPRSMLGQPDLDDSISISQPDQLSGPFQPSLDQQPPPGEFYPGPMPARQPSQQQQQISPQAYDQSKFNAGFPASQQGVPPLPPGPAGPGGPNFAAMDIDPNDPMLNADPFGLSASMHFPTSYHSFGGQASQHGHPQQQQQQQQR